MTMQIDGFNALLQAMITPANGALPVQVNGGLTELMSELLTGDSVDLSTNGLDAAAAAAPVLSADDAGDAEDAADADAINAADAGDLKKDPEQIKREAFDGNFTKEAVAKLLGKEAGELTDVQAKDLNDLLYGINEENAKRAAEGKDPMTRDEVNALIADAAAKYKEDPENESNSLGKTVSELGLEEGLDEDTFKAVEEALNEYNDSDAAKDAAEAAKQAEEEQQTEDDAQDPAAQEQAADQAAADQAAQAGNDGGGGNGGGGGGNGGGTSGVGGKKGAADPGKTDPAAGEAGDNLPDNLDELQTLRSEKQGKIDELKGQIDDKQAAINNRREEIIDKALGDEKNETSEEYKQAKGDFETAKTAKDAAQQKVGGLNQEAAANDQSISANRQQHAETQTSLNQAESELASLSDPGEDDPDGHADYLSRKQAIEAEIAGYKSKLSDLENEYQDLQNEKDRIADDKVSAQQDIDTQQMAMDDAQARMDKAADQLSGDNEEIKQALEEDSEIKSLQDEIEKAQGELAAAEAELSAIEAKISDKEMEDPKIREIRKEDAEFQFNKAAADLDAPVDEARDYAENSAAQDKYGKPYSQLSDAEKKALEAEITGMVTTDLMDWAKDRLMEDPYNSEALEILEHGYTTLEVQEQEAAERTQKALENLPESLKKDAKAAMEDAVTKAEAAGEDPNIAAMQALQAYSDKQLSGLKGEELKAVQAISDAAGAYIKAMERVTEGVDDLNDADFMQEIAVLPEPQRSEIAALRDSVKAVGAEQEYSSSLDKACADVKDYLKDHPDLTMTEAQEKFGVYGPAALAAAQDPEIAAMLEAEAKGKDVLNNQKTEIFMQGLGNYANAQADKAVGEEVKKWEAVGLASDKAVKIAVDPEVKAMLASITPEEVVKGFDADLVAKYVDGDTKGLNEELLYKLAQVGEKVGHKVHITSGFRTYAEQERLYKKYKSGRGNLAAKPGTSRHESGLAADCSIGGKNIGKYKGAVAAMKEVGLCLPVKGEAWHVELVTSKNKGSFRGVGK